MLRFFRLLRKKFIDDNNMKKYIWYALGEILLVVVGILIALQINNWNQEKKNREYELTMLREVREAMEIDIQGINSAIPYLQGIQYNIRELVIMKNDPSASTDSLYEYLTEVNGYGFAFTFNTSPFEAIESGGLDKISNAEIRNKLADLYGFALLRSERWINEVLREQLFKKGELGTELFPIKTIAGEDLRINTELILDDPEIIYDNPDYDQYLQTSAWALPATVGLLTAAQERMTVLMELIDEELEK